MHIAFQGASAMSYMPGLAERLTEPHHLIGLPEPLVEKIDRDLYALSDVIVSNRFDESFPVPKKLRLFHVPAARTDKVRLDALPDAPVCVCFGHESAIAEYVFAVMLNHLIPFAAANLEMKRRYWTHRPGPTSPAHGELCDCTIGILGFGHTGRAIAARAKAFGLRVLVDNRSRVPAPSDLVDASYPLDDLTDLYANADFIVVTLPVAAGTAGLVSAAAFEAMPSKAFLINVGRGPVVEERALYDALRRGAIAGAAIDTWYRYAPPGEVIGEPGSLPFHTLPNLVLTPHMSGWTNAMIRRRQETIAGNINRLAAGLPLRNAIRCPL